MGAYILKVNMEKSIERALGDDKLYIINGVFVYSFNLISLWQLRL